MQSSQEIPPMLISRLTNVAMLGAQRAGEMLRKAFGTTLEISEKSNKHDLVTEYDKKTETFLIEFIKGHFPDHTFLGEEFGLSHKNSDVIQWVIDPIDGTLNFARNIPFFSISIAATFQGKPLSGVVYSPMLSEMFVAEKGNGAYLNGKKLQVTNISIVSEAVLATGFPPNVMENPGSCIQLFDRFAKLGSPIRRLGSAALDLCYVAAGRYDGFWEIILQPWDFAAGMLIVQESGGIVTDFDNNTLSTLNPTCVLASNKILHPHMLDHLNQPVENKA